jgi:D-alanine-D-alanine ligase
MNYIGKSPPRRTPWTEIDTIPGFTSIGMYPEMREASGMGFAAPIDRLIGLALERHARKKVTKFTR